MFNLAVCYSTSGLVSFLDISRLRGTLFHEAYALGNLDMELIEVIRTCIVFKAVLDLKHGSQRKLGSQKAWVSSCRLALRTAGLAVDVVHVSASNISTVFGDTWSFPLSESVDHVNNWLLAIAISRVGFLQD